MVLQLFSPQQFGPDMTLFLAASTVAVVTSILFLEPTRPVTPLGPLPLPLLSAW